MSTLDQDNPDVLVIEAGRADRQYWIDLWRYRELFLILAWRDVAVRYKQTVIGVLWAFVRPFMTMVVFTAVFGTLAKLPTEGNAPYAVMVYAGLLPWTLFSSILNDASNSVIGSGNLITKVYFPRLVVPLATLVVALIDFLVSLVVLAGLMVWFGVAPGWQILLLPLFVLMALAAALGPALWAAALIANYRDFRFIIPFATQVGLYVSPVGFSSKLVPSQWQALYSINPMVGVIDGFRWCILGGESPIFWPGFVVSLVVIAALLFWGGRSFRRSERAFADML